MNYPVTPPLLDSIGVMAGKGRGPTVLLPSQYKPLPGPGTLSGTYPDGIVSIEGVPGRATIRVLYRPLQGAHGDGVLVATTESADDGTWLIAGLDPSLRYDVVFRVEGYPDLILSNIAPVVP